MAGFNKKRLILIGAAAAVFIAAGGAGFFLYSNKKMPEDNIPPVIKKIIELNEDVKRTTIGIYNLTGKLESVSMTQSRITDLETTIEVIANLRKLVEENQKAIDRLIGFAQEHENYFYRKNLAWIFAIKDFYTDYTVIQHQKSRSNYLAAFEAMVTYTYDHYDGIMTQHSSKYMNTYDVYYMRYRRAADSHNKFNRKRIAFQKQFVEKHPEVKPFLPGSHHLEPFKFWDRFSF